MLVETVLSGVPEDPSEFVHFAAAVAAAVANMDLNTALWWLPPEEVEFPLVIGSNDNVIRSVTSTR